MSQLSDQSPKPDHERLGVNSRGSSRSVFIVLAVLVLVGFGILSYFMVTRLGRIDQEVHLLRTQVARSNQKVDVASANAASALARASQAAKSALEAAKERNQAEKAKTEFQQQAQQAQQEVKSAQQAVLQAQQKAEKARKQAAEYRKEREAELDQLQQALNHIAKTRRTAMGVVMTLGSNAIRFGFDKSNLRPTDKEVLSRIAGILSVLKGYSIYVYGYTDDIGTQAYNLKLSDRRAKSVRNYLVQNGLNPNIITTKGFGKKDPLVPGSSPQVRAINRRVEIGIVDSTIRPITSQNQTQSQNRSQNQGQ